jgi:ArsR family transcriptional regulator
MATTTSRSTAHSNGNGHGNGNGYGVATQPALFEPAIREVARVFKLLSDETRLRILFYLAQSGELHVTDLCHRLGQSQPAVSHHLALLRVSGLIESRREGKHNFYSICADHFGKLLSDMFAASGEKPRKLRLRDFVLNYTGN